MSQPTDADRRQAILRRHKAGDLHTVIATDYRISRDQVRQIVKAEGGEPRRPARPLSAATAAMSAGRGSTDRPDWRAIPKSDLRTILAGYCDQHLTAQAIADRFTNCSRSAVIGQVYRFKLKLNAGKPRRRGKAPAAGAEATPKQPAVRRTSKLVQQTSSWRGPNNPVAIDYKARALQRAASPGIVIKRENAFDPIPGIAPVAFASSGCKWPVDGVNGVGLLACGAAKEPERSYCAAHRQLSYTPPVHRLSVPRDA